MSEREVSDELVRQVKAKTGESDLERGVWQLLYQGRGRYDHEESSDDGHRRQLSD